jgi:hypothetical protein
MNRDKYFESLSILYNIFAQREREEYLFCDTLSERGKQ